MHLSESFVVVAPDSSGKAIRNLKSYELIDLQNGLGPVSTLVQTQVTAIADGEGRIVDIDFKSVLEDIAETNRQMVQSLAFLTSVFGGEPFTGDPKRAVQAAILSSANLPPAAQLFTQTRQLGDKFGRTIMLPWGARELFDTSVTGAITDTTAHTLIPAIPDAYADILGLIITNTSASTSSRVDISDGTTTHSFQSIGGAGPVGMSLGVILKAQKTNTAWTITVISAVTDIRATAIYVKNRP